MAPVDTWYSAWAPEWLRPSSAASPPIRSHGRTGQPDERGAQTSRPGQRLDHADQGPHRDADDRDPHPRGDQDLRGRMSTPSKRSGRRSNRCCPRCKGTRSVFAERTGSGYFLDIEWNREELARYGLSIDEAQEVVPECHRRGKRHHHRPRAGTLRGQCPLPCGTSGPISAPWRASWCRPPDGKRQIPLAQLADIKTVSGPAMIRNEDGLLTGYVYVDIAGRDPNGYMEEAARLLRDKVKLPPGYAISWSGQYEAAQRVKQRLLVVVPLTLFLIFLLLYHQHPFHGQDDDRHPGGALFRRRGHLVPLSAGLQHEHRRSGWASSPCWGWMRRPASSCSSILTWPMHRPKRKGGSSNLAELQAGHRRRGGQADPAQVHDRGHPAAGARSDHVVHRAPGPT